MISTLTRFAKVLPNPEASVCLRMRYVSRGVMITTPAKLNTPPFYTQKVYYFAEIFASTYLL